MIVKERYDELSFPAAECWRPVVTRLFGATPEWEYMRNGGVMLFRKDTLEMFGDRFPAIESYARIQPYRSFTEFNFLGFFAERDQAQAYVFIDRNKALPPPQGHVCFWSWGGIGKTIEYEMEDMGLRPVGLTLGNRLFRAAKWSGLIHVWQLIKPPKRYF